MTVEDFMKKIEQQSAAPMMKNENREKSVEKIALNFAGNYGRYQILPLNNVITDYPFVKMDNTREICIPRKFVNKEGTEVSYQDWIKILPKSAYIMKDSTGRVIPSLTSEEERTLGEAYQIFDQLFNELDAKNNREVAGKILRKRNYTIFHAYCMNMWKFDDSRTPARQNFSGLFVSTAKGFVQAVDDDIKNTALLSGGDNSWLLDVYSNDRTGRKGCLMFNINRAQTGYTVNVQHKPGMAVPLQDVEIPKEDYDKMQDPVATFLGRQANYEENVTDPCQRRLFNSALIKEAINFMAQQLAAVRAAKSNGTSIEEAIEITNNAALSGVTAAPATNDPMLATASASAPNASTIQANNTDPYQNPPVFHNNPITGAPVAPQGNPAAAPAQQAAPFSNGFGQGFGSASAGNGDLPF